LRDTASNKFALLLSLADLSIAKRDDSGSPLTVSTDEIAEKFIQYYWRRAVPYTTEAKARVLQQNTGRQAAVVNLIRVGRYQRSSASCPSGSSRWSERLDFLYENTGAGTTIELRPGIAYCFQRFHALISDLVCGAWVRYVRQQNLDIGRNRRSERVSLWQ
jgi:hypothetical protein